MGRLFGTDGVRGIANTELTPELALKLGRAGAYVLRDGWPAESRPRVLLARDTRLSGDLLEAAMAAGLASLGADVECLGVTTTPSVAYLVRALKADAGAMISASHNPAAYNGIKFFSADGYKLPDALEDRIEDLVRADRDTLPRPAGGELGRIVDRASAVFDYAAYVESIAGVRLDGLRIVADCAHGAAYRLAPDVLTALGASVLPLNVDPDGLNINEDCGSTHPAGLQEAVRGAGADLGLAFDGDADRLIAVDEQGGIVDGDRILAICGLALKREGRLAGNTVVATVMSNLGLEIALREAGINLVRTPVGDRYVLEEMLRRGAVLGGEQSGHIIFLEYNTTGDGILTALRLLEVLVRSGRRLSELAAAAMTALPQVLVNVRVRDKEALAADGVIQAEIRRVEGSFGSRGRLLVRPSGTEPRVRIMLEGPDETILKEHAATLANLIEQRLG